VAQQNRPFFDFTFYLGKHLLHAGVYPDNVIAQGFAQPFKNQRIVGDH
jgi:hypothetical protein